MRYDVDVGMSEKLLDLAPATSGSAPSRNCQLSLTAQRGHPRGPIAFGITHQIPLVERLYNLSFWNRSGCFWSVELILLPGIHDLTREAVRTGVRSFLKRQLTQCLACKADTFFLTGSK